MNSLNSWSRFGIGLVTAFALLASCADSTDVGMVQQGVNTPTVTTDLTTYQPSQQITLTWSGMPGNPLDWVAIATAGSPDNQGFVEAGYTINGQTDGSHTFSGLPVGDYEARAYTDNSYTVVARSTFSVAASTTATITTDQQLYPVNVAVTATWTNLPGNQLDWIAIVQAGSPAETNPQQWTYTNGAINGSFGFNGLPAGDWEARAYLNNTYTILASSTFSVTAATVTTDQDVYAPNQGVVVSWTNLPGNPMDYVSINTAGSPADSGFVQLFDTNGQVSGSQPFSGLAAGSYEARAYLNNTYTILATHAFTVSSATVTTDASTYTFGQTVTVSFAGMPGNPLDWVAIYQVGAPDDGATPYYAYTNGATSGSIPFPGVAAGTYEARAYVNNTYTVIARSASFTVTATNSCMSAGQRPVFQSLMSGDLTIDTTQAENTVALSVPLASSVLFMSVREDEPSPNYGGVMCQLGATGITCDRNNMGTDTGSGVIVVHWTVATFTSGVTVQRGLTNTGFTDPSDIALTTVTPGESFVLLGGMFNNGTGWGNNEFVRAQLLDAQTLDLRTNVAGTQVPWQVVDMVGATVQRGTAAFATADTQQQATITTVPSGSMVLASYTTDNASGLAAAAIMMQTALTDPSTISFSRDLGGSNLDVSWEVVSLPFATHSGSLSFAATQTVQTTSVANIDPTTSVGLSGSQALLGASTGSTDYNGADVDLVGEAAATFTTATNSITLQRATSQADAEIPWTVIDFAHDCTGL